MGDFTIELKKIKEQNVLIVRAARSKLDSKTQDINFQGMDEKGPVKSILSHGESYLSIFINFHIVFINLLI